MVWLTILPPSKHVLMLSTPLISKIKNKFRATGELKHKFRECFKALKTNVSRKIFSDYLYVGLVDAKSAPRAKHTASRTS
jgi:hypothetical protein